MHNYVMLIPLNQLWKMEIKGSLSNPFYKVAILIWSQLKTQQKKQIIDVCPDKYMHKNSETYTSQ